MNQSDTPANKLELTSQGMHALDLGRYGEAMEIARQLFELRYSSGFEIMARALAAEGKLDEAISVLREGTECAPMATTLWTRLGECLSNAGRYEEADLAYCSALEYGSQTSLVAYNRALLRAREGRFEEALAMLAENPRPPSEAESPRLLRLIELLRVDTMTNVGRAYEAWQLGQSLLRDFQDAQDPVDLGTLHLRRAEALCALDRGSRALEEAVLALTANPDNSQARKLIEQLKAR